MPFSALGLSDSIVKAVTEQGYQTPTPIQEKAIPVVLAGDNLIAAAQTGTGKTASFVLPILQTLQQAPKVRAKRVHAVILTPTRELAIQVEDNIQHYARYLEVSSMAMYGGVEIEPQQQRLIEGVDILVATPGRLLDMLTRRAIHLDETRTLVIDEADRMLDMGFIADINKIVEKLPRERQNLLFSATLSAQVRVLAKTAVTDAVEIMIAPENVTAPDISQYLITVDKEFKSALLSHLIHEKQWQQALIFIETKRGAAKLVSQLEKRDIAAESFHSGRSQAMREQLLADFKAGTIKYLVATGVAARGIDIDDLQRVVNYDLPDAAEDYVHRIGRTGRAGASGEAISLVSRDDFRNLCAIEQHLGYFVTREVVEGFAPKLAVPASNSDYAPKSANKSRRRQPNRR